MPNIRVVYDIDLHCLQNTNDGVKTRGVCHLSLSFCTLPVGFIYSMGESIVLSLKSCNFPQVKAKILWFVNVKNDVFGSYFLFSCLDIYHLCRLVIQRASRLFLRKAVSFRPSVLAAKYRVSHIEVWKVIQLWGVEGSIILLYYDS